MLAKKIFGGDYDIGSMGIENFGIDNDSVISYSKEAIDREQDYSTIDLYNEFNISLREVEVFDKLYQELLKITIDRSVKEVGINSSRLKDILMDSEELYGKLTTDSTNYSIVLKEWLDKYDDYDIDQKGDKKDYSLYLKDWKIHMKERNSSIKKMETKSTATRFDIYKLFSDFKNGLKKKAAAFGLNG